MEKESMRLEKSLCVFFVFVMGMGIGSIIRLKEPEYVAPPNMQENSVWLWNGTNDYLIVMCAPRRDIVATVKPHTPWKNQVICQ